MIQKTIQEIHERMDTMIKNALIIANPGSGKGEAPEYAKNLKKYYLIHTIVQLKCVKQLKLVTLKSGQKKRKIIKKIPLFV